MTATWYNAERVAQPGSVILSNWKAEREAARIQNAGPTYPSSSGTSGSQLYEWLTGGNISTAGPSVTERTAMGISAVYACIGLIGGAISSLPLPIYRRTEAGRGRINHDVWWLLNEQPCACMSAAVMWEYLIWSLLLHGDAFARIQRASPLSPQIVGFEPVHPLSVQVQEVEERLVYTLFDDGETQVIDQDDMLHIPGLGFDGQRGLSPLRYAARQTFGLSLAAEEYSARFFSQGARPDYIITTEAGMNPEQQKLFRESWMARYAGLANSHIPAILAGGKSDVKALTLSPEEAQLIDDEEFRRAETVDGARKGVIGLGGGEGVDEIGGGDPKGFNFILAGGVGEGQGDVGLTNAGRAHEDEIGIGIDEIEGEGIENEGFGNAGGMGPVESVQGLNAGDFGVFHASADNAFMSKGILGREEPCEKFQVGNIFKGGLLGLILKGAGGVKEPEGGEQVGQGGFKGCGGHGVLLEKGRRRAKDPALRQ
jgi:HK97 family phage portal protein